MKERTDVQSSAGFSGKEVQGSFDLLKVILAYIVISRHLFSSFLPSTFTYSVLICETVSTAAVPIYFILSGYLFFIKPFSIQRLKHQLLRIFKLYLAWKVIYIPVVLLRNVSNNVPLWESVCTFIYDFVFPNSHLWYLHALLFALIFVSLMRNMKTCYAVVLTTGLFIAGLLLDTYKFIIPQFSETIGKIFPTVRNGLFFGTFYVYLGYVFS